MSTTNINSELILNLDTTLRNVLAHPTVDNIDSCFSIIKQCHYSQNVSMESTRVNGCLAISLEPRVAPEK